MQYIDKVVDVPVMMHMIHNVEVPQVQFMNNVLVCSSGDARAGPDRPPFGIQCGCIRRSSPTESAVGILVILQQVSLFKLTPRMQHVDRVVDVAVALQRQDPTIHVVQKTVVVPQVMICQQGHRGASRDAATAAYDPEGAEDEGSAASPDYASCGRHPSCHGGGAAIR